MRRQYTVDYDFKNMALTVTWLDGGPSTVCSLNKLTRSTILGLTMFGLHMRLADSAIAHTRDPVKHRAAMKKKWTELGG